MDRTYLTFIATFYSCPQLETLPAEAERSNKEAMLGSLWFSHPQFSTVGVGQIEKERVLGNQIEGTGYLPDSYLLSLL